MCSCSVGSWVTCWVLGSGRLNMTLLLLTTKTPTIAPAGMTEHRTNCGLAQHLGRKNYTCEKSLLILIKCCCNASFSPTETVNPDCFLPGDCNSHLYLTGILYGNYKWWIRCELHFVSAPYSCWGSWEMCWACGRVLKYRLSLAVRFYCFLLTVFSYFRVSTTGCGAVWQLLKPELHNWEVMNFGVLLHRIDC